MPTVIGVGQLTLLDLNDAIVSGTPPANPAVGALWIDESATPNLLKKWDGTQWIVIGELDPNLSETISDIQETLGNMANDNILDINERQVIKDKLTEILGYVIADNANTLPINATLDASGIGEFYAVRQAALVAGISATDPKYTAVATKYTDLKVYLESLTPIKPWNTSTANKDVVINVDKATFRDKWLQYYNAVNDLATATAKKLKENVDNVTVGGTNYASNGDFLIALNKGLWANHYVGSVKEIVDISTEEPPFQFALHIKNTSNINGGIFTPVLWSGKIAESLVNKEVTISFWLKYQNIVQGSQYYNLGRFGELIIEGEKADGSKVYRYPRIVLTGVTESSFISGTDMTWRKYVGTIKLSLPYGAVKLTKISFKHGLEECQGEFWTTGIKIEIGNKATDWSPSPFDIHDRLTKAEFKIEDDRIVSVVTSSEEFVTTIDSISQNISNINTRLTTAEEKITDSAIINTVTSSTAWSTLFTKDEIAQLRTEQLLHNTMWDAGTDYWTLGNGWTLDGSVRFEGNSSMKQNQTGQSTSNSYALESEKVFCTIGDKFVASIYAYTDNKSTIDIDARMEIAFYNTNNSKLLSNSVSIIPSTNSTWERFSVTGIAPANTSYVKIRVYVVRNGRIWVAHPMLQKGVILTAWTPHIDELATDLRSQITQTAGRVDIVVDANNKIKAEQIASAISVTPNAINMISQNINLTGKVTFSALDSSLQTKVNNGDAAKSTVDSWKVSGKTTINGGMIETGTITADKIKVGELVVGVNVAMSPSATISWSQVTNKPYIPQTASDIGALPVNSPRLTYIDSSGIYTGTINANQITAGTISANRISGGTLSGVTINVDTDVKVGNALHLGSEATDGIRKFIFFNDLANISGGHGRAHADIEVNCNTFIVEAPEIKFGYVNHTIVDFSRATIVWGNNKPTAVFG